MPARSKDIEALARMAARLAGRDPDEQVTLAFPEMTAFEGPLWQYPDFIARAETAYEALRAAKLVRPGDLNDNRISRRRGGDKRMSITTSGGGASGSEQRQ